MMAMAVGWRARKAGDDHVGLKGAHDTDHVPQNLLVAPFRQRLVGALREPKIVGAGEELLGPVHPSSRQQFFCANDPQRLKELGAEPILPAVATGHGQVGRPGEDTTPQIGQQGVVLVVGVGSDMEHARIDGQPVDRLREAGGRRPPGVAPRICPRTLRACRGRERGGRGCPQQDARDRRARERAGGMAIGSPFQPSPHREPRLDQHGSGGGTIPFKRRSMVVCPRWWL